MQLLAIRNGLETWEQIEPLRPGTAGNERTLSYAIKFIREDSAFSSPLRQFVESLIEPCRARDFDCEIARLFEFAQKKIRFVQDPVDVDRVADAATTQAAQQGDCLDKSGWLASALGSIGYVSRLVGVNFFADLDEHGLDHVFLEVQYPEASGAGSWIALDPTPENAPEGWEPAATDRKVFEIWPNTEAGVGDWLSDLLPGLLQTGTQLGTGLAQSAIRSGQATHAQELQIGHQFDTRDIALVGQFNQLNAQPVISVEQLQEAAAAVQQLEAFAQQYSGIDYVRSQWAAEGPRYQAALQGMAAKVPAAAASQQLVGTTGTMGTAAAAVAGIVGSVPWYGWAALAFLGFKILRG